MADNKQASESTEIQKSWIEEAWTKVSTEERVNPLQEYTLLKVYNPNMGQTPDPQLDGKIVKRTEDGWEIFSDKLEGVEILDLTKCYAGYADKLSEWQPVKDDNGKTVKELYFTPEVSVYSKDNIALAKFTETGPVVLWKGWFQNYMDFTTAMQLPDGTLNPLFKTINTNTQTGEKYPVSVMNPEVYIYFRMDWQLFKLKLGASYGRWKDIKDGTFLAAKDAGAKAFKETHPSIRFEHHYLTLDGEVKAADKYKYLEWSFKQVTATNVVDDVMKTKEAIKAFNESRFPGVATSNGMEALPFDMNRLLLSTSEKVSDVLETKDEPIQDWEISVDDLPF